MKTISIVLSLLTGWGLALSAHAEATQPLASERALLAYLKVVPGAETEFLKATQAVIEKSRQESGNLVYTLHQSVADPTQFVFYEVFRSHADLEAHRQSVYVVDFLNDVKPILVQGGFTLQEFSLEP